MNNIYFIIGLATIIISTCILILPIRSLFFIYLQIRNMCEKRINLLFSDTIESKQCRNFLGLLFLVYIATILIGSLFLYTGSLLEKAFGILIFINPYFWISIILIGVSLNTCFLFFLIRHFLHRNNNKSPLFSLRASMFSDIIPLLAGFILILFLGFKSLFNNSISMEKEITISSQQINDILPDAESNLDPNNKYTVILQEQINNLNTKKKIYNSTKGSDSIESLISIIVATFGYVSVPIKYHDYYFNNKFKK